MLVSSYLLMIDGQQFIRQALPAALVDYGHAHKAVVRDPDSEDERRTRAERRLLLALENLFRDLLPDVAARLAEGEMPTDAELSGGFARVIEPQLVETAVEEFARLGVELGVQFDPAQANLQAARWARTYVYDLVKGLTETTRATLQDALGRYQETPGMTRAQLEALIEPAFGPARASAISVTEVTRGFQAAMDDYKAELATSGLDSVLIYHTALDDLVCPICSPDDGKPESEWTGGGKPPRHTNCRCSTSLAVKPAAKFNPYHDERGRFTSSGSATSFTIGPGAGYEQAQMHRISRAHSPTELDIALESVESVIRPAQVEVAYVFDGEGKLLLSKHGDKNSVTFTDAEVRQMKNAVLTHNHPSSGGLSPDDVKIASVSNAREIRAIGTKATYIMRRPANGWPDYDIRVAPVMHRYERQEYNDNWELVQKGKISVQEAQYRHWHDIWQGTASEAGLDYKRIEVK